MVIRSERIEDIQKIRSIHVEAFDTEAEADLVEALRNSGIPLISLVAEKDGELFGHILFSPVALEEGSSSISIAGLAPMAVLPAWQNEAIGSMLVEKGLTYCKNAGYVAVVVLGHPNYYPRFGFVPSIRYGITSEYDVPREVFMAKELQEGALANCNGIVKYQRAFNQL